MEVEQTEFVQENLHPRAGAMSTSMFLSNYCTLPEMDVEFTAACRGFHGPPFGAMPAMQP